MSGARAVTSLELRRHLRSTLSQSPRGQHTPGTMMATTTTTTTTGATSPLKIPKRITKVRRDLFGPIDRDECNRFIDAELNRKQTIDSERWGFDFANGVPLYNNENFEWEPVYNFLPNYYSQSHHQRQPDTVTVPTVSLASSSHYFQEPNDFDVTLIDQTPDQDDNDNDDPKIIIDSTTKQLNEIDLDAVVLVSGSERTPLQNHNSNQQPCRKYRQLSITDLMRNRKRFATAMNVSPVKKTTATMTSTTATATITSSPLQPQSSSTTTTSKIMTAPTTTITSATATATASSNRRLSYDSKRTAKKLKFSHEPQTK